jgi:D-arabinose 1-dehydrogenase-like Zn-dependent alcohol dehydrogenase
VEAAALPVNGLTAWQALAMLGLGRGQRLLVTNGAGNTGSLAIQLAAAMGVEVTATASAAASDRLRGLGAAQVVDYHDPNWPDQVRGRFDAALTARQRHGSGRPAPGARRRTAVLPDLGRARTGASSARTCTCDPMPHSWPGWPSNSAKGRCT